MWSTIQELKACADKLVTHDYAKLKAIAKEIYADVGGVSDWDENFDFEREPTADELPRFVAEKVPKDTEVPAEEMDQLQTDNAVLDSAAE